MNAGAIEAGYRKPPKTPVELAILNMKKAGTDAFVEGLNDKELNDLVARITKTGRYKLVPIDR